MIKAYLDMCRTQWVFFIEYGWKILLVMLGLLIIIAIIKWFRGDLWQLLDYWLLLRFFL